MKGGGNHHMLCSPEKSNTYPVSNDRERCSISQMKPMGYGKAKALLRGFKSCHSLGKNLSRGFSMTEHVESELLLLLLPGRQRHEPNGNHRKRKQGKDTYTEKNSVPERILKDNQALY